MDDEYQSEPEDTENEDISNVISNQGSDEILSTWKANYLSALILPEDTIYLDQVWDSEISRWNQF